MYQTICLIYTHAFKLYGNMPERAALHHASFHTSAFGKPHSLRSYKLHDKHGFLVRLVLSF